MIRKQQGWRKHESYSRGACSQGKTWTQIIKINTIELCAYYNPGSTKERKIKSSSAQGKPESWGRFTEKQPLRRTLKVIKDFQTWGEREVRWKNLLHYLRITETVAFPTCVGLTHRKGTNGQNSWRSRHWGEIGNTQCVVTKIMDKNRAGNQALAAPSPSLKNATCHG